MSTTEDEIDGNVEAASALASQWHAQLLGHDAAVAYMALGLVLGQVQAQCGIDDDALELMGEMAALEIQRLMAAAEDIGDDKLRPT